MKIALATCKRLPTLDEDDALLIPLLEKGGLSVETPVWDDSRVNWKRYGAVVIRSTWDYHRRRGEFLDWVERLDGMGVRVWNPPEVLRWNTSKDYLRELTSEGVPTVPTLWVDSTLNAPCLAELLASRSWDEVVLKPVVSAGGDETYRFSRAHAQEHQTALENILKRTGAMVQPFLSEVLHEGEWSFLFFGGRFSHSVLKAPARGDYRVQKDWGGSTVLKAPKREWIDQASAVLRHVRAPLLYARVDMIRREERLLLVELELTEPSLFFSYDPASPLRFADALKGRLGQS